MALSENNNVPSEKAEKIEKSEKGDKSEKTDKPKVLIFFKK